MKIGETLTVELTDGSKVDGQVWSHAEPGYVWLALGNGRFGKVSITKPATVTAERGRTLGQVAR